MVILYDPKESRRFIEDAEVRGRGLGSRLLGRMQLIQQRDYGGSGTTSSKRLQPKVGVTNRCKHNRISEKWTHLPVRAGSGNQTWRN